MMLPALIRRCVSPLSAYLTSKRLLSNFSCSHFPETDFIDDLDLTFFPPPQFRSKLPIGSTFRHATVKNVLNKKVLEVKKDVLPRIRMSTRLAWIERATVSSILRPPPPPLLLLLLLTSVVKEEEEVTEEDPFPDEEKDLMALPPPPPPLLFRAIFHFSLCGPFFLSFLLSCLLRRRDKRTRCEYRFFVGIL